MGSITHEAVGIECSAAEWLISSLHRDSQGNTAELSRSATYVIAPSNASAKVKAGADLVLTGSATSSTDGAQINTALASYIHVLVAEGTVYLETEISLTDTVLNHFHGAGWEATKFQAITVGMNMIHISGGANFLQLGNFILDGDSKAAKGLYVEHGSRITYEPMIIVSCTDWGLDLKYNHTHMFSKLVVNSNGHNSSTGGIRMGAAGSNINTVHMPDLLLESNYIGVLIQRGTDIKFDFVIAESNQYQAFLLAAADAVVPADVLIESVYLEDNNLSDTAGLNDIQIVDGVHCEIRNYNWSSTHSTYGIDVQDGARYFTLGNGSGAVYIDCDEAIIHHPSGSVGITIGTNCKRIINARKVISATLVLDGAATDVEIFFQSTAAAFITGYDVVYTEASSADAGVLVRIGRYQNGVALDDDYFDVITSEVSKNKGYSKRYYISDMTNYLIAAGDTITVGTAGGKVGTGEVKIVLEIMESN